MTEKRRHRRYPRRYKVRFGEKELSQFGFTSDLSTSGLFVIGTLQKLHTRLHLELTTDRDETRYFEGRVMRLASVPAQLRSVLKAGFGVRLLTPAEVLAEFFPKPVDTGTLVVRFETPESFVHAFESEFKRGGAFAWGNRDYLVNSTIHVEVEAGWLDRRATVDARVMSLVPGADGRTGVALMFIDTKATLGALAALSGLPLQ